MLVLGWRLRLSKFRFKYVSGLPCVQVDLLRLDLVNLIKLEVYLSRSIELSRVYGKHQSRRTIQWPILPLCLLSLLKTVKESIEIENCWC